MSELLPPVVGRLLGDTRDFTEKMRGAHAQAQSETEGMSGSAERMRGRVGGAFTAVGGLATGAGAMLEHMGHQGEQAEAQLKTAIDNTGRSFPDYEDKIGKTAGKMMDLGFSHSATEKALAQLTTATQDPKKALDSMGLVADIARSKHMSLEAAANKLGLAYAGNTRIFKQFGITVDNTKVSSKDLEAANNAVTTSADNLSRAKLHLSDEEDKLKGKTKLTVDEQHALRDAHNKVTEASTKLDEAHKHQAAMADAAKNSHVGLDKALDQLSQRVKGQAANQADNFGGKLEALKMHAEGVAEAVGAKVGPAMVVAGPMMMGLGQVISSGLVPKLIMGVGGMFEFAASSIGAGISAAAAAIPVIIAWAPVFLTIAALVAAGYFIYSNWDTIWSGIKNLVGAAVGFIKGHIEEFVGILFPPIGVFFLIRDHWRDVWEGMHRVVGVVIGGISGVVKTGINDVLYIINKFIGAIDSLEIHIPSVGFGPVRTPGFDWGGLGIPYIPYLAAGGTALKAGWAVVGDAGPELMHMPAGASVAPLPAGGAGGGVVVHLVVTGNTILGGDVRKLAQDLVGPLRTELIRTGGRQALGLPA